MVARAGASRGSAQVVELAASEERESRDDAPVRGALHSCDAERVELPVVNADQRPTTIGPTIGGGMWTSSG